MRVMEGDDVELSSGVELVPQSLKFNKTSRTSSATSEDIVDEEQGGEDEHLIGEGDDIGWTPPHGLLWEVDQRVCYMIVISMTFSISAAVYLALFVYHFWGFMYISLHLSLFTLIDTFLSVSLLSRILYFVKGISKSKLAASRLFVLIPGAVVYIVTSVWAPKLRSAFCFGPDGRNIPGTASMKNMFVVLTALCVITAASKIVDALMSTALIHGFQNAQWYNSLLTQLTVYCPSKHTPVTPLCSKVCSICCLITSAISILFFSVCMKSYVTNLVIDHSATATYEKCDPLIAEVCALPWPNDFFTEPCNTTVTGLKIAVGDRTLPLNRAGVHINPTSLNTLDGFSTSAPILFFMDGLSMHGFPSPLSIEESLTASTASWLLDTSTGERVPHFVQLDIDDPEELLAVMQPAVQLAHGTRYVVGIVGSCHVSGDILPQTPGFSALLDASKDLESENARAKRFVKEVFPFFENMGISPSSLQLAFDFTTISTDSQLGLVKKMRSHAKAVHSASNVKLLSSDEDSNGFRTIWATITVPAYVDYYSHTGLLSPCGQSLAEGDSDVECELVDEGVLIRIPPSVLSGDIPLTALLQYGHSLFNNRAELLQMGFIDKMSNDTGWIMAACDFKGMSVDYLPAIARGLLSEDVVSSFANMMQTLGQAFVIGELLMAHLRENWLVYASPQTYLMDGEKAPVSYYYGISEGGNLGAGYILSTNEFSRSVLAVCGSPHALLLPRSLDFIPYLKILNLNIVNAVDIQLIVVLWQSHWDALEAGGWLAAPREEGYATQVLIQEGIGDARVSNIGAKILARGFNAVAMPPLNQSTLNESKLGDTVEVPPLNHSMFGIPFAAFDGNRSDQYCSGNTVKFYNFSVNAWPNGRNTSIVAGAADNLVHFKLQHYCNAQNDAADFLSTGCIDFISNECKCNESMECMEEDTEEEQNATQGPAS